MKKTGKCAFTQIRLWKEKWGNTERGSPRKVTVDPAVWKLKNKVDPWPLVTITHLCCKDLGIWDVLKTTNTPNILISQYRLLLKETRNAEKFGASRGGRKKGNHQACESLRFRLLPQGFWVNLHWDYFSSWFRGLGSQSHCPLGTQCATGGHTAEEFHLSQSRVQKESRGRQTMGLVILSSTGTQWPETPHWATPLKIFTFRWHQVLIQWFLENIPQPTESGNVSHGTSKWVSTPKFWKAG